MLRLSFIFLSFFLYLSVSPKERANASEMERSLAEEVDAALAGLGCDLVELRATLQRAKPAILDLLRVPVSEVMPTANNIDRWRRR